MIHGNFNGECASHTAKKKKIKKNDKKEALFCVCPYKIKHKLIFKSLAMTCWIKNSLYEILMIWKPLDGICSQHYEEEH